MWVVAMGSCLQWRSGESKKEIYVGPDRNGALWMLYAVCFIDENHEETILEVYT